MSTPLSLTAVEVEPERRKGLADFLRCMFEVASPQTDHRTRSESRERLTRVHRAELAESRGLSGASGSAGGYLVPSPVHAEVMRVVASRAIVRPRATIVPMEGLASIKIPALAIVPPSASGQPGGYSGGLSLTWSAESSVPSSDPAFSQVELIANALTGSFSVPIRLLRHASPAADVLITEIMGAAVALMEDYAFLRGNGVGKPLGILNSPALVTTAARAASGTITLADRLKLWAKLLPSSKPSAVLVASQTAEEQLLTGVAAGDIGAGDGETHAYTLLGRPVIPTGCLPALNTLGDLLAIDPRYYLVGDGGTEIAASGHVDFARGLVWFRVVHYVAGLPWPSGPVTLTDASTTASPFVALGTV